MIFMNFKFLFRLIENKNFKKFFVMFCSNIDIMYYVVLIKFIRSDHNQVRQNIKSQLKIFQ